MMKMPVSLLNLSLEQRTGLYKRALQLHETCDYSSFHIAKILGLHYSAVRRWIKDGSRPDSCFSNIYVPEEKQDSFEFGYILGCILGDGCLDKEYFRLTSIDHEFAQKVAHCILALTGVYVELGKDKRKKYRQGFAYLVRFGSYRFVNQVVELLGEKVLGQSKTFEWRIPSQIDNFPESFKVGLVKGFFDSEAHVNLRDSQIHIELVNYKGLEDIRRLLASLCIESIIEMKTNNPVLIIRGKQNLIRFANEINFSIPRKSEDLKLLMSLFGRRFKRLPESKINQVLLLRKSGFSLPGIVRKTEINGSTVRYIIKRYGR
jgi:intein-encoded DNA endonuclease-like protein